MSKPNFDSHSHFRDFPLQPNYKNELPPDQLEIILGETPKEKKRKNKKAPETKASRQRVSNTTAASTATPTKQRVEVIEIRMLFS